MADEFRQKMTNLVESIEHLVATRDSLVANMENPTPPTHNPDDPGYCYLLFFQTGARARAEEQCRFNPHIATIVSHYTQNNGDGAPLRFELECGLPPLSPGNAQEIQCHVAPTTVGGIGIKDLAHLPGNWRIGGNVSTLDTTSVNTLPSRRVMWEARVLGTHEGDGSLYTCNLDSQKRITEITSVWPVVSISDFEAHIHPTPAACTYFGELTFAWHARSDTPPTSAAQCLNLPCSGVHTLVSPFQGGYWPSFKVPCPLGTNGLSDVVKAPGCLELYPSLTLVLYTKPLPGQAHVNKVDLAKVFFSMNISIGV